MAERSTRIIGAIGPTADAAERALGTSATTVRGEIPEHGIALPGDPSTAYKRANGILSRFSQRHTTPHQPPKGPDNAA